MDVTAMGSAKIAAADKLRVSTPENESRSRLGATAEISSWIVDPRIKYRSEHAAGMRSAFGIDLSAEKVSGI